MGRVGGVDKAVEEFEPVCPRPGKQPVLCRGQPDHRDQACQLALRCRIAIDARFAAAAVAGTGPDPHQAVASLDFGKDSPARRHCAVRLARDAVRTRRAQAPTRRQEGQGLQQVCLARPVGAVEGDRDRLQIEVQRGIAAKIGQPQTTNRRRRNRRRCQIVMSGRRVRHTRNGIST